jgi:hypothetical protein
MEGRALVFAEREVDRSLQRLRQLRENVGRSIQEAGIPVSHRFDRYAEMVLVHSGYQREVTRALLEAGLDRLSEAALALGALDQRALDELCQTLEQSAETDASVLGLVAAYRRVVAGIERSIVQGASQRREQSLERALRSLPLPALHLGSSHDSSNETKASPSSFIFSGSDSSEPSRCSPALLSAWARSRPWSVSEVARPFSGSSNARQASLRRSFSSGVDRAARLLAEVRQTIWHTGVAPSPGSAPPGMIRRRSSGRTMNLVRTIPVVTLRTVPPALPGARSRPHRG